MILLETQHARVICDALPITVGHVLIATKDHIPSMLDLAAAKREHIRVVQYEVGRRLRESFGAAGHYEHGRSTLCRFHVADPRHVHAHVHSAPLAFDLVAASGCARMWRTLPENLLEAEERYVYQEFSDGYETWGAGSLPEVRHFVRTYLQEALRDRGVAVIPVDADPAEHDSAVDETASRFRGAQRVASTGVALTLTATAREDEHAIVNALAAEDVRLVVDGSKHHTDLRIHLDGEPNGQRRQDALTLDCRGLTFSEIVGLIRTAAEIRAM